MPWSLPPFGESQISREFRASPSFLPSFFLILSDGNKFQRRQSDKVKIPESGVAQPAARPGEGGGVACSPVGPRPAHKSVQAAEAAVAVAASRPSVSAPSLPPSLSEYIYSQKSPLSNSDPQSVRPTSLSFRATYCIIKVLRSLARVKCRHEVARISRGPRKGAA